MKKLLALCLIIALTPAVWAKDPEVIMRTTHGDVTIRLFAEKAPISVANFLAYVEQDFYVGTIFHRVIPRFMIQTGGFNERMQEKPTLDPIVNEAKNRLHNERGTLAMARTNDPDSATSQFFINVRTNLRLDWTPGKAGYTVFGEVLDGMSTVDAIAIEPTGNFMGHQNVPLQPIKILSMELVASE
ncbi:peptidyl-prolyl cis-trans isomerase [Halieaceae bacterium IMCC14734]|uniref:Peptidyl-prolyl cis-trans isomerase n=1 Tax=Candidatus Litorirhabdus singularis TaxID=2518993 RepID=A0ABT3TFV0_9GAMM|nr:peptidylprolyl isomerase [Candidatus Litorirhabdus singularis]MCX2981153.1 peptidyl-prolyl cis-trans isomerase [Candidatus Litorirhabdus singularis]